MNTVTVVSKKPASKFEVQGKLSFISGSKPDAAHFEKLFDGHDLIYVSYNDIPDIGNYIGRIREWERLMTTDRELPQRVKKVRMEDCCGHLHPNQILSLMNLILRKISQFDGVPHKLPNIRYVRCVDAGCYDLYLPEKTADFLFYELNTDTIQFSGTGVFIARTEEQRKVLRDVVGKSAKNTRWKAWFCPTVPASFHMDGRFSLISFDRLISLIEEQDWYEKDIEEMKEDLEDYAKH